MKQAFAAACWLLLLCPQASRANEWQSLPAIQATVENFVRQKATGMRGERSVTVSRIDNRIKLERCDKMEAYLPGNNRLTGNVSIGVRCQGPASWSLFVPVQIKVVDEVLVAAQSVSAGQALQAADLKLERRDVTAIPGNVLNSPEQAIGRNTSAPLAAGTVIRMEQLRAPNIIVQGQQVKLVAQGSSFKVTSEGLAMGNATLGQVVAVKTRSGQVIKGIARSQGVVEVYF